MQDYYLIILYLEEAWSVEIAEAFVVLTESRLEIVSQHPLIGIFSEKQNDIRSILITKHNRLYYRVDQNKLIVLNIFDTRQNPASNKF